MVYLLYTIDCYGTSRYSVVYTCGLVEAIDQAIPGTGRRYTTAGPQPIIKTNTHQKCVSVLCKLEFRFICSTNAGLQLKLGLPLRVFN
jgi:hypothetical protein